MKKAVFFLVLLAIFSCRSNNDNAYLVQIDSLITKNLKDSAFNEIKRFDVNKLKGIHDSAYYNLMKTELLYWKGITIPNDSMIDKSIAYYKGKDEPESLGKALYLKGMLIYLRGNRKEGTAFLKQAENLAEKSEDNSLRGRIKINLACFNCDANEYETALKYAKQALVYAGKTKQTELINNCLSNIGNIYGYLGNLDSAYFYIDKCEPLIKSLHDKDEIVSEYINLGAVYEMRDVKKSKEYIFNSIAIEPKDFAYHILAALYLREDSNAKAEECWHEAMRLAKSTDRKISIMEDVFAYMKEQKRYKEASEAAETLQQLKDNLSEEQRRDSIREVQEYYDTLAKMDKAGKEGKSNIMTIAIATILLLMLIFTYIYIKRYKENKAIIADKQQEVDKAVKKAEKSETKIEEMQKKVAKIKRAMKTQETDAQKREMENSQRMAKGHKLYKEIVNGGNTFKWTKEDIAVFVEYYYAMNTEFANKINHSYTSLTNSQKLHLALYDMGMDDNKVMEVMCLTAGALRVRKSRLEKQYIGD